MTDSSKKVKENQNPIPTIGGVKGVSNFQTFESRFGIFEKDLSLWNISYRAETFLHQERVSITTGNLIIGRRFS